jgi:UDP-glucose 4-epimerase
MILLTGSSGFIGRHLLRALVGTYGQENVIACASRPAPGVRTILHHGYAASTPLFPHDKLDAVETLLHAGAFTPKGGAQANQALACTGNITSTLALLQARLPHLERVVFLSTVDVYAPSEISLSESSPTGPVTLYGHSKLYCEQLVRHWCAEENLSARILRVGHIYGPGEEAYRKVIPATFAALMAGAPVTVYGEGKERRAFLYVDDLVTAILRAIPRDDIADPINLVSGHAVSMAALVNRIIAVTGVPARIERVPATAPIRDVVYDNARIRELLLPEPETSLDAGLRAEFAHLQTLT